MNIREFNILLNKILKSELEFLRKRFRPYKKRLFLRNDVRISIDLREQNDRILGYYENTKSFKRQRKYTHKIFITKLSLNDFRRTIKVHYKRFGLSKLRDTIRHELIHAFVFEEFEQCRLIDNSYCDYSPIFLGCLAWCCCPSGHPYTNNFFKTELYRKMSECKNYDDWYACLIDYIFALENTVRKINQEMKNNISDHRILNIKFNQHGAGIVKRKYISATVIAKKDNKLCRKRVTEMTLGLGFLVTPEILLKNYKRKFENDEIAKVHSEIAAYVINDKIKQKKIIFEKIS